MIRKIDRSVWDAAPRETLPHIDAIPYGTLPRLGCYPAWDAALYGTLARMGRRPAWDASPHGTLACLELWNFGTLFISRTVASSSPVTRRVLSEFSIQFYYLILTPTLFKVRNMSLFHAKILAFVYSMALCAQTS